MIEFIDVNKTFKKVKALDNFNLKIEPGKIIGLLGPNGSGKSTSLKMIAGLNKPDSGKVLIDGDEPCINTKEDIAYLPEIDYLYSNMNIKQISDFISSFYSDWDCNKYKELLKFLNLEEDMVIGKVSKGMRAKIKLLLTFSRNAKIVLLDEPLSGIDILTREEIIETIIKDYREGEQTIILSTHEILETENIFEDVIFVGDGKVKLSGNVDDIKMKYNMSLSEVMKEVYRNAI
ncbi:ABC transporter ATP-binding protein [Tepidibacter hydrothermalis]|uniref:ABC transporter ATP-binding protein n=1 Tax=Tepidibacter hydrothermalis TaxID=3036126 RepID=A0ABY8EE67_9FIRM|nr:ABC transporter ATP-binding protein [Tepidibacter hydrothermalis]WFD09874.1 ABC transporter ATP-binding protein [Tepidibacter hydrothermalis]